MKKYNDLAEAQQEFYNRRKNFLELNYQFYLNLINQIREKGEIPSGNLTTYQNNTRKHINIIEEWVNLNEDGSCSVKIGIISNNTTHDFDFITDINGKSFILYVTHDMNTRQFNFDLKNNRPEDINFDEVIDYIFTTVEELYKKFFNI